MKTFETIIRIKMERIAKKIFLSFLIFYQRKIVTTFSFLSKSFILLECVILYNTGRENSKKNSRIRVQILMKINPEQRIFSQFLYPLACLL